MYLRRVPFLVLLEIRLLWVPRYARPQTRARRLERWERLRRHEPIHFVEVPTHAGEGVGRTLRITQVPGVSTQYLIDCALTDLYLLHGREVNAYYFVGTSKRIIQPVWVDECPVVEQVTATKIAA